MKYQYRLYGVEISYFVGKVRAYLNYKGLDYEEKQPSFLDLRRFRKRVNAPVMPVVQTLEGDFLADTSLIIEALEKHHPEQSIKPNTPRQKIAAMLFEAWLDEVGHLIAVHTRWSHPENYPLFRDTMGKAMFPFLPKFLRDWLVGRTAVAYMRENKVKLGIVPGQTELLDRWIVRFLDTMEAHFAEHDYLLGGRPCIADYALIGPCYGHLYLDPWPRRELIEPRPNLKAYIERVHRGDKPTGDWLASDEIPASLDPVFETVFAEFYPLIDETVRVVSNYADSRGKKAGDFLPRFPGEICSPMLDGQYRKLTLSYTLWMLQRVRTAFRRLPAEEQAAVEDWFDSFDAAGLEQLDCGPEVERFGLTVRLA